LLDLGIEPVSSTRAEFVAFIKASVTKYTKIVNETGANVEWSACSEGMRRLAQATSLRAEAL